MNRAKLVLASVAFVVLVVGSARFAPAGLINYWKLDDASGATAAVDSAGGLDATLHGDAGFVQDVYRGQVLNLDGSGDYASNSGQPFTAKTTHTVALWAKHDTLGGQRYISWGPRYFLGVYPEGYTQGDGCMSFAAGGGDKVFFTDAYYGGSNPTVDTSWHHWAAVFDSTANLATLYRDGEFFQQKSLNGGTTQTTAGLALGRQFNGGEYLDGRMDDLAIWNESLDATQIYNAMKFGAEYYNQAPSTEVRPLGIVNGDFELDGESASITGWTEQNDNDFWATDGGGISWKPAATPSGDYFLSANRIAPDPDDPSNASTSIASQRVDLSSFSRQVDQSDAWLDLSGYAYGGGDSAQISLAFYDALAGGNQLGSILLSDLVSDSNPVWRELLFSDILVPVGARSLEITLIGNRPGGTVTDAGFDNITGTITLVVPEAASVLTWLLLGTLALIRFRRRRTR